MWLIQKGKYNNWVTGVKTNDPEDPKPESGYRASYVRPGESAYFYSTSKDFVAPAAFSVSFRYFEATEDVTFAVSPPRILSGC